MQNFTLSNPRDKLTQTLRGIEDFRYRFGRLPEGMWLAETAADNETLDVLAQSGIRFTGRELPPRFSALRWSNVFSRQPVEELSLATILSDFPVALLCGNAR